MTELNGMKIRIGPMGFNVEVTEGLSWETPEGVKQELNGSIQYSKLTISIEQNLPRDAQLSTLLHECIHGMLEQGGLVDHDEGLVTLLGYALFDFVRKNKHLITEIWDEQ